MKRLSLVSDRVKTLERKKRQEVANIGFVRRNTKDAKMNKRFFVLNVTAKRVHMSYFLRSHL